MSSAVKGSTFYQCQHNQRGQSRHVQQDVEVYWEPYRSVAAGTRACCRTWIDSVPPAPDRARKDNLTYSLSKKTRNPLIRLLLIDANPAEFDYPEVAVERISQQAAAESET